VQDLIIDARLNEYTGRESNPKVPFSPEEIARDSAECRDAGAAIVHYHARDPETGAPSADPELYAAAARGIREQSDVLVMPTLGAGTIPDLEGRFRHVEVMADDPATRADIVPLDFASTNLPIYIEGEGEVGGDELAYSNTVGMLKALAEKAAKVDAIPMAAIWNVGSLRLLDAFLATGVMRAPCYAELFLTEGGLIAGHPCTRAGLDAYLSFLPKAECAWAVACYGANVLELAEIAIARGGHVALGLGDYPYGELGDGTPANAEVVAAVADIARRNGRKLAQPNTLRSWLAA
jgi:uncharacterized protein (DUF849 family)